MYVWFVKNGGEPGGLNREVGLIDFPPLKRGGLMADLWYMYKGNHSKSTNIKGSQASVWLY